MPVLVSICSVVMFVGAAVPAVGCWVWLDGVLWIGSVTLVCMARVENVVEGAVCRVVASVGDP